MRRRTRRHSSSESLQTLVQCVCVLQRCNLMNCVYCSRRQSGHSANARRGSEVMLSTTCCEDVFQSRPSTTMRNFAPPHPHPAGHLAGQPHDAPQPSSHRCKGRRGASNRFEGRNKTLPKGYMSMALMARPWLLSTQFGCLRLARPHGDAPGPAQLRASINHECQPFACSRCSPTMSCFKLAKPTGAISLHHMPQATWSKKLRRGAETGCKHIEEAKAFRSRFAPAESYECGALRAASRSCP